MGRVLIGNIKGKNGDNGNGIASITTKQSAIPGAYNTITINMTDGRSESFNVRNGSNGLGGAAGERGADATINGVNTLTLEAKGGIAATQDGDKLTLSSAYPVGKNILDNTDFANPVNQRGKTAYTGVTHTIDRWKILTDNTTLTIVEGGVKLNRPSGTYFTLAQSIDSPKRLYGKTVTLSVLMADGSFSQATQTIPDTPPTGEYVLIARAKIMADIYGGDLYAGLFFFNDGTFRVHLRGPIGNEFAFAAVKLEIGDTQTLVHNEGTDVEPKWVLNEIPDYTEELVKCQRYQYALFAETSDQMLGNAIAVSKSQARVLVPITSVLRHKDVELERSDVSHFCLVDGSQIYGLTNISLVSVSNGTALLLATTSGLTVGNPYFFAVTSSEVDAKFILNANL